MMKLARVVPKFTLVLAAIGLSGCGYITPQAGPSSVAIDLHQVSPAGLNYGLVKISPEVVNILARAEPWGIAGSFHDQRPPPQIKFGVGDVVTVTIFEAGAGGLFIPIEAGVRPGNFVTLPNEAIDAKGNITVPYAGEIHAAGKTPTQVQNEIIAALRNRAIQPQVIVSVATQNTSLISVLGSVNRPSRFPAQQAGERILDALTRAGGIKDPGYETWVVLERHGRRAGVPFGALIYDPRNNIWVHPGDTIYVYSQPQTFLAFGGFAFGAANAANQQAQFSFGKWRITLAEAIAKTGGLLDTQADPASVYIYRREVAPDRRGDRRRRLTASRDRSSRSSTTSISAIPPAISWRPSSRCATTTSSSRRTRIRWKSPSCWCSCERRSRPMAMSPSPA